MNVGLYFGSFNPIHIGHLIIANHVINNSGLQKIWFVISPQNPFKQSSTLLNEYDRLHLLQLAISNNDNFRASDVEFALPKPSYTAHTLTYLSEKYPFNQFSVIMGSDSFQNLPAWKNSYFILKNFSIVVYKRPGFEIEIRNSDNVSLMEAPLLQISATDIRRNIQAGKSIKYLVPDIVREEIERSGLYKNAYKK